MRNRGFTFIEVLAASTILLFILFAAYNVIDTNQRIAVNQNEMAEMDASGRTAVEQAVLGAGYGACLIDPNGYRRGRLNEPVPLTVIGPA